MFIEVTDSLQFLLAEVLTLRTQGAGAGTQETNGVIQAVSGKDG